MQQNPKHEINPNVVFCWVSELEELRKGMQQEPELANSKGRTPRWVGEHSGAELPPFSSRAVGCTQLSRVTSPGVTSLAGCSAAIVSS